MKYPSCLVWLLPLMISGPGVLPAQTAAEMEMQVEAVADLIEAAAPEIPPALKEVAVDQRIKLRLVVDEHGTVVQSRVLASPDDRLDQSVLAAVNRWRFRPALTAGRPVASGVDVEMPVRWPQVRRGALPPLPPVDLSASPMTKPREKHTPSAQPPAMLEKRHIIGRVAFSAQVDPDGRVRRVKLHEASHPEFVRPTLESLERWEYVPAMQGDLPVAYPLAGVMTFDRIGVEREEILAANAISMVDAPLPDVPPEPVVWMDSVQPFEELMEGRAGWAVVEFTVSARGAVLDPKLVEASAPACGHALLAALAYGQFMPGANEGRRQSVRLQSRVEFEAVPPGEENPEIEWQRVLGALRRKEVGSARGLDERITPLLQVPAIYPVGLTGAERRSGEAEIEVIIDRTGRVRLPKIFSASHEAFGWAAATAISLWVFKPPMREGEPVDVRVRVPFEFTPPDA